MKVKSYAKINTSLKVDELIPTNFHNIESIIQKINLYDEIFIENNDKFEIEVVGAEIDNDKNLVLKAYENLQQNMGIQYTPKIELVKNIPIGSGLGGGSSNYASTIKAIINYYNLENIYEINKASILNQAKKDSTDSLFFLSDYSTAKITGIGDEIRPVESHINGNYIWILIPDFCNITARAYETVDKYKSDAYINDFDFLLERPEYSEINSVLKSAVKEYHITGSGSAIWFLDHDIDDDRFLNKFNVINTHFMS